MHPVIMNHVTQPSLHHWCHRAGSRLFTCPFCQQICFLSQICFDFIINGPFMSSILTFRRHFFNLPALPKIPRLKQVKIHFIFRNMFYTLLFFYSLEMPRGVFHVTLNFYFVQWHKDKNTHNDTGFYQQLFRHILSKIC